MSSLKGHRRWAGVAMIALGLSLVPIAAMAQGTEYTASLSGDNQPTPVSTSASGTFDATVDLATATVTFTLSVPSIENATQAHIHAGVAGEAGPVVVALFAADGSANTIDVSTTFGAADLVGPYAGDPVGFVGAMNDGSLYVNVHTEANPAGELRGQIQAGSAPVPALLPAPPATGDAGLLASGSAASLSLVAMLAAAAVAIVFGGRMLTSARRTH